MMNPSITKILPRSVLIVEDDDSLRNILIDNFKKSGFLVYSAVDGDEALEVASNKRPDMIILDLLLPKIGGLELLEVIRKKDWGLSTPVVVLTNVDDIDAMNQCIAYGVRYHYIKSDTSITSVVESVNKQLSEHAW